MKIPPRFVFIPALLLALTVVRADQKTKTLDVYWIDSEGGGSTLIVTPTGESVLIDAGSPGGRDPARIVAAAKAAGLAKIDYLAITHWHGDHFGGSAELAALFPIETIYQRGVPDTDPDKRNDASWILRSKPYRAITSKREAVSAGVSIPLKAVAGGPQLSLRCLAADTKFVAPTAEQKAHPTSLVAAGERGPEPDVDNDNSAVWVLSFGNFRFFDGGDLTWAWEPKLVSPYNLVGKIDVYQTNHHGLDRSNNPMLIQGIAPTVAVMNNGPRKGGQAGTLATLKGAPSVQAIYQLHKSMAIPAEANTPDDHIANLEEAKPADKCAGNVVKMSVAADGKSYTISIPANGHSKTYQTTAK